MSELPKTGEVLRGLKDFQRATVDYVHERLWDDDGTGRFLVADEVGLGKTHVARGVVARAVEHLTEAGDERIDIVYICSNGQIAAQNLRRLNVIGGQQVEHADRLTMLPKALRDIDTQRVNFISFTPGTSFDITDHGGKQQERVLLYWLLERFLGSHEINLRKGYWTRFFEGYASTERFKALLRKRGESITVPETFVDDFTAALKEARTDDGRPLVRAVQDCATRFHNLRGRPEQSLSRQRYGLIGALRALVARTAVRALHPDLVILDEFHRFKDLLTGEGAGSELAGALMSNPGTRVLLLSATPYKMYTLPDEPGGEDHHEDFVATYKFLAGDDKADELRAHLRVQREALLGARDQLDGKNACVEIENRLREVMCRTERTTGNADGDSMVTERPLGTIQTDADDLRAWLGVAEVAKVLDAPDQLEYWRSAPYLLNLMDHQYKAKHALVSRCGSRDRELAKAVRNARGLLRHRDVHGYGALEASNAKMRALFHDVLDREAFRLPWIAPSLPYWTLEGPYADPELAGFTKRLVFSAWAVVPKSISVMLSYEAERRLVGSSRRNYDDRRQSQLLTFSFGADRRLAGMPVFALMYPSPTLARLGDPLRWAREHDTTLPLDRAWLMEAVTTEIQRLLDELPRSDAAVADQRWYWAAPLVLDADVNDQQAFLTQLATGGEDEEHDWSRSMAEHIERARDLDPTSLGPMPDDLAEVLAAIALAGPGTVALRALLRLSAELEPIGLDLRRFAWWISAGFRSFFNRPEIIAMLRREQATEAYWRSVLNTCLDGCIGAALDEYVHMLADTYRDADAYTKAYELAWAVYAVLGSHADAGASPSSGARTGRSYLTALNTIDDFEVRADTVTHTSHRMRSHLAQTFGRRDEDNAGRRDKELRDAFNSPFWPYVLASTSVGQEGLDFHTYCHAVVHWNLPSNPVDLEQREGRVHRFKGHAVRKNVAAAYGHQLTFKNADPWEELFEIAVRERADGHNDLVPYWICPGEAGIERFVPIIPLSREVTKKQRLLRTLGAYRLVLGQPRQDDLLAYLGEDIDHTWTRIDLRPERHR